MTDLKLLGISEIRPWLADTTKADVDVRISEAPSDFHLEAAKYSSVNLRDDQYYVTIVTSVGQLKNQVFALATEMHEINVNAMNIQQQVQSTHRLLDDEADELNWP